MSKVNFTMKHSKLKLINSKIFNSASENGKLKLVLKPKSKVPSKGQIWMFEEKAPNGRITNRALQMQVTDIETKLNGEYRLTLTLLEKIYKPKPAAFAVSNSDFEALCYGGMVNLNLRLIWPSDLKVKPNDTVTLMEHAGDNYTGNCMGGIVKSVKLINDFLAEISIVMR